MTSSLPKALALAGVALAAALIAPRLVRLPFTATSARIRPAHTSPAVVATHGPRPTAMAVSGEPVRFAASATPVRTVGAGAWMTLATYAVVPGATDIGVTGGGFAPGESVDLHLEGAGARVTASLRADASGRVAGTAHLWLAPDTTLVRLQAVGRQSGSSATATIHVVPFTAVISLVPYVARPGQSVEVQGQGFDPDEVVYLMVGPAAIGRSRADGDGRFDLRTAYTVPYAAGPGFPSLAVVGGPDQPAAAQRLYVVPLRPWATASSYVVHRGDRVRFDLHGFAAGEYVDVYAGRAHLGRSATPTDLDGHVATVGPFVVPAGDRFPTYTFIGARSGARLRVTLTELSR